MILLLVALLIVGVLCVVAFGGLTALLRDDAVEARRERLFGDTVTTTVVLAAGAIVIGLAVLALVVVGLAGVRS